MNNQAVSSFGRVDDDLNVYVFDKGNERRIGQMPGKSPEEAINFYIRKFEDLAAQVRLLEQRVAAGVDGVALTKAWQKLNADLVEPSAVGDLASLRSRLTVLEPKLEELRAQKSEATKAAVAAALAAREAIVSEAEALVGENPKRVWKTDSAKMVALFEKWQEIQKTGSKPPKSEADALWKRFSTARKSFDNQKRNFFANQDAAAKEAKGKKAELVKQAQALAESAKPSVLEYRKLLDAWKLTGRSAGKSDDALWNSFKAAGDKIYAARAAEVAATDASQAEALSIKKALLEEAKAIDPRKDLAAAKKLLSDIQKRWAAAGRVSKEALRETDDRLRAIEKTVRDFENEQWKRTDPAAIERNNAVLAQLEASITSLRASLKEAQTAGDPKKIAEAEQALKTREEWLEVVRSSSI